MDKSIFETLHAVAEYYDAHQVGNVGAMGFRRSTKLANLLPCLERLLTMGVIVPKKTRFLDMGCADGRVNVFLSFLLGRSVGIELDDWILDDYQPLRRGLEKKLKEQGLLIPPENIHLFLGNTMDGDVHETIERNTGIPFDSFDLFYTYLIMQDEFAALITQKARKGAVFAVYGLERIQPDFPGLRLLTRGRAMNGVLALYEKE